jgi:ABC-type spermidine/putrescine transport system permease subunit I
VGAPVTLQNYIDLFTQPVYRAVMWRSLTISLLVTATTVILAYPIAYFVSFHVAVERKVAVAVPDHHPVLDQLHHPRLAVAHDPGL